MISEMSTSIRHLRYDRDFLAGDDALSSCARRHHRQKTAACSDVQNSRALPFLGDGGPNRTFKGVISSGIVQHSDVPERNDRRDQAPQLVPYIQIVRINP
jgi:hypothetical protein